MSYSLLHFIDSELHETQQINRFRVPKGCPDGLINLSGNDYLGLANNEDILTAGFEAAKKYGAGGQSSRLVSGTSQIHAELEQSLANWLGYESALVFNSGYQLNTSVLKTLGNTKTVFFIDKLAHNSLLNGAFDSQAETIRFRHNDMQHLEKLIQRYDENQANIKWILVESIYSMDGDEAPLEELSYIAKKYDCNLYIDEAHAIGITGEQGRGLSVKVKPDVYVGTFGKAFGTNGAFIASSRKVISYLVNKSAGFIYTTAPSPFSMGATLKSLEIIRSADDLRIQLQHKTTWLRSQIEPINSSATSTRSCIIPWLLGDEEKTLHAHDYLFQNGFYAPAIRPPTVPVGTSRIRFCLSCSISEVQLNHLVHLLDQWHL